LRLSSARAYPEGPFGCNLLPGLGVGLDVIVVLAVVDVLPVVVEEVLEVLVVVDVVTEDVVEVRRAGDSVGGPPSCCRCCRTCRGS
jgi:hypothetical protein